MKCFITLGESCDNAKSTCNGRNELCHGRGPAWPDDTQSTAIIGKLQSDNAVKLYMSAQVGLDLGILYSAFPNCNPKTQSCMPCIALKNLLNRPGERHLRYSTTTVILSNKADRQVCLKPKS